MELRADSDVCEDLALRWLEESVGDLDELLKKNGVASADAREEILTSFFFDLAVNFDGARVGGFEHEGREYHPVLAFLEKDAGVIHFSNAYDLHDQVHFEVGDRFEDNDG